MAECVAVTRYIYLSHVLSDKRRENKGLNLSQEELCGSQQH